MKVRDFTVEEVLRRSIAPFIEKYHYSQNVNGVQSTKCFGLYKEGNFGLPTMIGAMMYAWPSMPATAKKYNPDDPLRIYELRRLVCIDDTPTNTESYFIGQTLKWLKKNTDIQVIVSFADPHYGHSGVIYKASNFIYKGKTGKGSILMVDGKEMHSRSLNQRKRPYSREIKRRYDAGDPNIFIKKLPSKHIYVYYLDKRLRRKYEE